MDSAFHDLLRQLVRARTIGAVATGLSAGVAASRSVVLARVWVGAADGLMLMGSAGTPSGGGSYTRVDGDFREMAVADATIRSIAESRELFLVRGLRGDEDWLINPSWAARQGVRAFAGLPLLADAEAVGVLALFDREIPSGETLSTLQLLADIAAARVADLSTASITAGDPPPQQEPPARPERTEVAGEDAGRMVLTREELRRVERENIAAALERTGGKVFGVDGAAALLGMKPTTLASRIKALGIR